MKSRRILLLFGAVLLVLLIRAFVFESYHVFSHSMYPLLWEGDFLLVTKFDYSIRLPFSGGEVKRFRSPRRSEIVAFSLPAEGNKTFVKRVVGIEGDRIEIRGGKLILNGTVAEYDRPAQAREGDPGEAGVKLILEKVNGGTPYRIMIQPGKGDDYGPAVVPEGHFFALGDNRSDSIDSRKWGPVPYSHLVGRARAVWLSISGYRVRTDRWVRLK